MAVRGKKKPKTDPSFRDLKAEYYPVQRQINLGVLTPNATSTYICDVSRQLSVVNHRLYRQGKTYQVKVDLDNRAVADFSQQYDVYALADTWYVQKAWQLARSVYLRSTADERAVMSEQKIARWEDFTVTAGITGAGTIVPYRYSPALVGADDIDGAHLISEITLSDGTTQRSFTWGATGGSSLGMLEEYDKTGDTDASPSTGSAANAYAGTDGDVHESQMDDLRDRGALPPYNAVNFNSSIWVKVATLDNSVAAGPSVAGGHSRMSTGFFNAPCGLVVIKGSVPNDDVDGRLSLTVKAGKYKGTAAMNMGV